jgi:hypothetical protein
MRCSHTVDLPEPSLPITAINGGVIDCMNISLNLNIHPKYLFG